MPNYILLVFEGERAENQIFNSLNQHFLNEQTHTILLSIYCNHIYSLYHKIESDPDLDLFALLKDKEPNRDRLSRIPRDSVSEIYLFFDYDGHTEGAADENLVRMLEHFNEETENGKLYLSYPMVEALKHLKEGVLFQDTVVDIKPEPRYKHLVSINCDSCYSDFTTLSESLWKIMISEHCKKLNYLMNDRFELPSELISQIDEFKMQQETHITPNQQVSVISAFPIFIADYYGYSELKRRLEAK